MFSKFFTLDTADLAKGLVVAVLAALLTAIAQALTAHGFDFASYDWELILNVSLGAGGSYISKNLLTADNGKFMGTIG